MYCTVLSRCRERLQDCKCTVWNRFRKSWAANVLYCAEQMQGDAGLQIYYAEQIQEKLEACAVLSRCTESLGYKCTVRNKIKKSLTPNV
jgi:hypothetical protein